MKRNTVTDAVGAELDRLGVRWTWQMAGKHARIVFEWHGEERFIGVPLSPRDTLFAPLKAVAELRRMLGIRCPEKRRNRNRRERTVCRIEPTMLAAVTPGADGLSALASHPMARKPLGYLGRFWFGDAP